MTRMSARLLVLLLLLLAIACAKSDDDLPPPPPPGEVVVGNIVLNTSSPTLPSASGAEVIITAYVRDGENRLMSGVDVTFAANNDGSLSVIRGTTDTNGTAEAKLTTPDNKANREITITATAESITRTTTVEVTGTTLGITGPVSGMLDEESTFTITLRDSDGVGIPNATLGTDLTVTSTTGNPIVSDTFPTESNGQANVTFRVTVVTSTDTITVSGFGTQASRLFNVTSDYLAFVEPEAGEIVNLGIALAQEVIVQWQQEGVPVQGGTVTFSTNRGKFVGAPAPGYVTTATSTNGLATVNIYSDDAGPAVITAKTSDELEATREIIFVATITDRVVLQANPDVIAPGGQSQIVATVFDPNDNLVMGKTVNFNVADSGGGNVAPGTAVTGIDGKASNTFTASTSGAQGGVRVTALVDGIEAETTVTVGGEGLFIALSQANEITVPNPTQYALPYSVTVTDSSYGPVANQTVTLTLWPTHYRKGEYLALIDEGKWAAYPYATCANEDVNRNGILDPGEDINFNGTLEPGGGITVSPVTVTTDSNGYAAFNIIYNKDRALWVGVELTATTMVAGSESSAQDFFTLPILNSDLSNLDISPPGGTTSRFGSAAVCSNPN